MKTLLNLIEEQTPLNYLKLENLHEESLIEAGKPTPNQKITQTTVHFEKKEVGYLTFQGFAHTSYEQALLLSKKVAPLLTGKFSLQIKTLEWLDYIRKEFLDKNASWVGVYWKENFIRPEKNDSTDLILGPYIGFATPHIRISLQKGLCGRAIRENQTLNIDDVTTQNEYLSCSIETKSEIVIPLRDKDNIPFGELDIDSKVNGAFNPNLQKILEQECLRFTEGL